MAGGRFKAIAGVFRRPVQAGVGQALRDAHPLEAEADAAMQRCIDQLNHVEGVLESRKKEAGK